MMADDEMDEKQKKRKELERLYEKTMVELFKRVEKAKTVDECRDIGREFSKFGDKLIAEDPELYKSFLEEHLRFEDALSWKINLLGGGRIYIR